MKQATLWAFATASVMRANSSPAPKPPRHIVLGTAEHIYLTSYMSSSSSFTTEINYTLPNTHPSWLTFVSPNLLYAVNENSANTLLYRLDTSGNTITEVADKTASKGVVHLGLNKQKTRMLGAGYWAGSIDVWDISNSSLTLLKSVQSTGQLGPDTERQEQAHPHQSINDPTGRFFAVNDLGTDTILVLDSKDDTFNVVNAVKVQPAGSGPRHGVFYPKGAERATHYFLLCELSNQVQVYTLSYNDKHGISFQLEQSISTYNAHPAPAGATAGELVLSSDNKDVYLSNRNTGQETDNIVHMKVRLVSDHGHENLVRLEYVNSISTGGTVPRMFSMSDDGTTLFVGNQKGPVAVAAVSRQADGSLNPKFDGVMDGSTFGDGLGPQYIEEIS